MTLYDAYLYQFVNLFYTSLPIMIYCLFDQELDSWVLLSNPSYYFVGLKNLYFNLNIFLIWFFYGIVQAMAIALFASFLEFHP